MGLAQTCRAGEGLGPGRGTHSASGGLGGGVSQLGHYPGWGPLFGRGQRSFWPWSAGLESVSLVVLLAEVRLGDSGATLAQDYLCGVTDLGQSVWGLPWLRSEGLGVPLTRLVRLEVLAAREGESWHSQTHSRAVGETGGAAALLPVEKKEEPEPWLGL